MCLYPSSREGLLHPSAGLWRVPRPSTPTAGRGKRRGRRGRAGGRCSGWPLPTHPPLPDHPQYGCLSSAHPLAPTRRPSRAAEASAQPGLTSSQQRETPGPRGVVRGGRGEARGRRSPLGPGPGSAAQPHLPADVDTFRDATRRRRKRREVREVARRVSPAPPAGQVRTATPPPGGRGGAEAGRGRCALPPVTALP